MIPRLESQGRDDQESLLHCRRKTAGRCHTRRRVGASGGVWCFQAARGGACEEVSEPELCEYVEAVNLTGDFDMPAGQVAFWAKVGEKYKLRPGILLEERFGAVARYKGKGRLPGFHNFKLVDVDVIILGEEYRRDGFAIAVLYSAPKHYFLKFFKQLSLQSFHESQ